MAVSRFGWVVAAAALPLAACGSGGSGDSTPRPPITLKGASYWLPGGVLTQAELRDLEGGAGQNLGNVLYVDDGVFEFFSEQTGQDAASGTSFFRVDDDTFAIVSAPDGRGNSQYSDMRLLRLVYEVGGQTYISDGVLGRFTSNAQMNTAAGTATYFGDGTASARYAPRTIVGQDAFDLLGGDATVQVNFDSRTVNATLDNFGASGAVAPVDTIVINGMTISGNEFSGGSLTATKSGGAGPVLSASGGALASAGVFAGWNDGNGTVAGGNRPAEVGGTFVAQPVGGTLVGRYVAD